MSRFSLIPDEFSKTDEAMRKAELWDEFPKLHGEPSGDPPPIALRPHGLGVKVNWPTVYLDKLHKALVEGK